jgi:hypothetical protein
MSMAEAIASKVGGLARYFPKQLVNDGVGFSGSSIGAPNQSILIPDP